MEGGAEVGQQEVGEAKGGAMLDLCTVHKDYYYIVRIYIELESIKYKRLVKQKQKKRSCR